MSYDNATIVRYLMGVNDDPVCRREDFLNPDKVSGRPCSMCNRSCDCA